MNKMDQQCCKLILFKLGSYNYYSYNYIVLPTFTTIGQDAVVDNGGVYTVTCRADGQGEIQYELLKDDNEVFGFQVLGSVVSKLFTVCCIRIFVTVHSTLKM